MNISRAHTNTASMSNEEIVLHGNFKWIPSLQEIEKMKRQRRQSEEALEISGEYVKCQKCSIAVR